MPLTGYFIVGALAQIDRLVLTVPEILVGQLSFAFDSNLRHLPALLGVFLIMKRHSRILDERVITIRPRTVEMSVDFVASAIRKPAVDVPIVKLEPVQNFDVVVEVLRVDNKDVFLIGDVEAPVLVAVVMRGAQVRA